MDCYDCENRWEYITKEIQFTHCYRFEKKPEVCDSYHIVPERIKRSLYISTLSDICKTKQTADNIQKYFLSGICNYNKKTNRYIKITEKELEKIIQIIYITHPKLTQMDIGKIKEKLKYERII